MGGHGPPAEASASAETAAPGGPCVGAAEVQAPCGVGLAEDAQEESEQVLPNGARYKGQYIATEGGLIREGQGVQIYPDGGKYIGSFVNNKAEGFGVFHHADGSVYEGQWLAGAINGEGKYTLQDGTAHVGRFVDGKQSGPGCETLPDGQSYVGEYLNGNRHGEGLCTWGDGHSYQGQWQDNVQHGEGVVTWGDGRTYQGSWRRGEQHGFGTSVLPDGRRYVGQYERNQKHGRGTFTWPDGREFSGSFRDGKLHGLGWYTSASGERRQGLWEEGQRVRWVSPLEAKALGVKIFFTESWARLVAKTKTKVSQVAQGACQLPRAQRCVFVAKCAWIALMCTLLSSSMLWFLPCVVVNLVLPMMHVSKAEDVDVAQAFIVDFETVALAARAISNPRRLAASSRDCARRAPTQGLEYAKGSPVAARFLARLSPRHRHLLREPLRST